MGNLIPEEGLEPPRRKAQGPKPCVSTNFTIRVKIILLLLQVGLWPPLTTILQLILYAMYAYKNRERNNRPQQQDPQIQGV